MLEKKKSLRMEHIASEQRGCQIDPKCTYVLDGVNCVRSCRPGGKCFEGNEKHPEHPPNKKGKKKK